MFKKKPVYIVLLIIFTLLLCADIFAYRFSTSISSNMPTMPSGDWSDGSGEMPSGFSGSMPNMDSSGEMPAMNDNSGDAPATDSSGDTPALDDSSSDVPATDGSSGETPILDDQAADSADTQDGAQGNMPGRGDSNFDPSTMQGGFDRTNMDATGSAGSISVILSFLSDWWIPIGILCVLVDAFCIFMLIRISMKRKLAPDSAAQEAIAAEELLEKRPELSGYEKRRQKRRRTIRAIVVFLVVVAVFVLGFVIIRNMYMAQYTQEDTVTVVSAEVSGTEIDTVISGTGTLAEEDAQTITIPGGVEIATYYVEDGDVVEAGDLLATVDHTSVIKAIADLQDAMDVLDEDIEDASSDEIDSKIYASVDGRVKVIYAQEDVSVVDTMYDSGALMLISLDGLMAADIETDADIAIGDSVTVLFADGTEETGRVDKFSAGVATITVTDDGTVYGDEVTISDEDGSVLGTATLYIHSELKVTGFSGTISAIKCDENDEVDSGDTLMTLTDTEYTAEYESLLETRSAYEEEMMKLFELYQDGDVYSEYAGTVSGVDEESATGNTLESESTSTLFSGTVSTFSSGTTGLFTSRTVSTLAYQKSGSYSIALLGNNPSGAEDATVQEYSNFVASVSSISYAQIGIKEYPTSLSITDYSDYNSLGVTSEMMTAEMQISPSVSTPVYMYENGAWTQYTVSDISQGDVLILTYDTSTEPGELVWIIIAEKAEIQTGGTPSSSSGSHSSSSGASSSAASSSTTQETEETYTLSETTVMSVTPSDTMSVTITIDELDILSMEVGQEATITLDAIEDQTFTGSVTDIDLTGTNSGGSTKFTAIVTLDRTEQMLTGMNAAVSITLSSTECTVSIPVAALNEFETDIFVYTSYDEENETLGDPVYVTLGLSDGTNVEITSGINSGDTVWYEYTDEVTITSSVVSSSNGGSGFNIMRMFGGR